ncbi:TetR/AcrR family transcriptional regulator [Actinoplanes sp. NPDC049548]|uniref:TetR/AcrR family transcriptional regulator n=1 Tax=Actinoplanes sp. NPDC049548 TaxID=3155152 RepID=UPI00341E98FC
MTTTESAGTTAGPRLTAAGKRTRDRIVGAAAGLMFRKGVAGTTIPEVQQAAKVSASQVYHYFADKNDLVRAVIEHQIENTLEVQRPLLDHLDSFGALRAWAAAAVAAQESRSCAGGCEIGSLASELAETDETMRADLVAAFERWERPIRDGLRRMRDNGILRPEADVEELAAAMLAAIQGGLLLAQVRRTPAPFKAATDAAIGYIETFAA